MHDERENTGDYYDGGAKPGGAPTEGFARLSDIPTMSGEEIQTNTIPKMRETIEKIARKLGATVLLLLISVAVAYGDRVQNVKFNEVDYDADPGFVASIDLSGLATTEDLQGEISAVNGITSAQQGQIDTLNAQISGKQDTLTAGASIDISDDNVISVYGDEYSHTTAVSSASGDRGEGYGYQGTINAILGSGTSPIVAGTISLKEISIIRRSDSGNWYDKTFYCRVLRQIDNVWTVALQSSNSITMDSVLENKWLGPWTMEPTAPEHASFPAGEIVRIVWVEDTSVSATTYSNMGCRTTGSFGGFLASDMSVKTFAPSFKIKYQIGFATIDYVDEAVDGALGEVDSALEEYATTNYVIGVVDSRKPDSICVDRYDYSLGWLYLQDDSGYPAITFVGWGPDKAWVFPKGENDVAAPYVASQDWVQSLGYITSAYLADYMTKAYWNENGVTSNATVINRSNDAYTAAYMQDITYVQKNADVTVADQESGGAGRAIVVLSDDSTTSSKLPKARIDESISNTGVSSIGATAYTANGGSSARMSVSAVGSTSTQSEVTSRANSTEATLSVAGANESKLTVGKMTSATSPNVTAQVTNGLASVTLKDATGELTITPTWKPEVSQLKCVLPNLAYDKEYIQFLNITNNTGSADITGNRFALDFSIYDWYDKELGMMSIRHRVFYWLPSTTQYKGNVFLVDENWVNSQGFAKQADVVNTVNEVKGKFWDEPQSVLWTVDITNGDMHFSATTNVNESVLN